MADVTLADILQGKSANNFGPLTPEQKAMLERDKINESLGPFDLMPGPATAGYAGGAAAMGALLPGGLRSVPYMARMNRMEGATRPRLEAVLDGLAQTGALGAGGALYGYGNEIQDRYSDRSDREQKMMHGNPADAEGQPGGFYGQPRK